MHQLKHKVTNQQVIFGKPVDFYDWKRKSDSPMNEFSYAL